MEHFSSLLNLPSNISEEAINALPQLPLKEALALARTLHETITAIKQMSKRKAHEPAGIPAEIYRQVGYHTARHLMWLFCIMWEQETVPWDFKDANIVHLYKHKSGSANCDNHCVIFLGKFLHGS